MIKRFKRTNIYKISLYENKELIVSLGALNISNKYDIIDKAKAFINIPDKIVVEDSKGNKIVYNVHLDIISNPYLSLT